MILEKIIRTVCCGAIILVTTSCQSEPKIIIPQKPQTTNSVSTQSSDQGSHILQNSAQPKDLPLIDDFNISDIDFTVPPNIQNPPFFSDQYSKKPNIKDLDTARANDYYQYVGDLRLFAGLETFDFAVAQIDPRPYGLAGSYGYNLTKTNKDKGRFIAPLVKFQLFGNRSEYPWGNYSQAIFGGEFQYKGLSIGGGGALRHPSRPGTKSDEIQWSDYLGEESQSFFTAWLEYWNEYYSKSIPRLGSIQRASTVYDGAFDNLVFNGSIDLRYLLIGERRKKDSDALDLQVWPLIEYFENTDTNKELYFGYSRLMYGCDVAFGPFVLEIRAGEQDSRRSDYEGPMIRGLLTLRSSLNHNRVTSRPKIK